MCVSCLKENEDCLKKFAEENAKVSKEEFKNLTEDVKEVKMIIRMTDKVEAFKEEGKQMEELQKNLKKVTKVSIQKLDESKFETKQWSVCSKIR